MKNGGTKKNKVGFWARLFRKDFNFFEALSIHAAKVTEGVNALAGWAQTNDPNLANRVRQTEHDADALQMQIEDELGDVFATPIDREDIHQICTAMDQIINYAKNTVREMEIFNISCDEEMIKIICIIQEGTIALKKCVNLLMLPSPEFFEHIEVAVKSERIVEKFYREGLNNLFSLDDFKEILKRREVYRHLSNTADRIHEAANLISMIHVKYT